MRITFERVKIGVLFYIFRLVHALDVFMQKIKIFGAVERKLMRPLSLLS